MLCLECKHLGFWTSYIDETYEDYPCMELSCDKGYWDLEVEDSKGTLLEKMRLAQGCGDFEKENHDG